MHERQKSTIGGAAKKRNLGSTGAINVPTINIRSEFFILKYDRSVTETQLHDVSSNIYWVYSGSNSKYDYLFHGK